MAEVLITLGIIGVVAALTMPSLISNYEKQVAVTRLKEVYSILSRAMLLAQKDYGELKYWSTAIGGTYKSDEDNPAIKADIIRFCEIYVNPYLSGAKIIGYKQLKDAGFVQGYKALNGRIIGNSALTPNFQDYIIELKNGQVLFFTYISSNIGDGMHKLNNICVYTDINGRKGPGVIGHDLFSFFYDFNTGRFLPLGYNLSYKSYCKEKASFGSLYCAARIMQEGWQITEEYPW